MPFPQPVYEFVHGSTKLLEWLTDQWRNSFRKSGEIPFHSSVTIQLISCTCMWKRGIRVSDERLSTSSNRIFDHDSWNATTQGPLIRSPWLRLFETYWLSPRISCNSLSRKLFSCPLFLSPRRKRPLLDFLFPLNPSLLLQRSHNWKWLREEEEWNCWKIGRSVYEEQGAGKN